MTKYTLPVNVDTTYGDSGTDPSVKLHQQHHDTLHGFLDRFETTYNPPQLINVRDYGAVFDGVTDDTAAIQAALNAAAGAEAFGNPNDRSATIVQLPPGRAYVSQIKLPANVWLRGHGASATYLQALSTTADVIKLLTDNEVQTRVSDLGIIGKGGAATAGAGIHITQAGGASITGDSRHIINDVMIVETYYGIQLDQGTETRITRCTVQRPQHVGIAATQTDMFISDTTVAGSAFGAFDIYGGNTRIWGCKAFGGGDGNANTFAFHLGGSGRHEVACCEVQDFNGSGFSVDGQLSIYSSCLVDSSSGNGFHFASPGSGFVQGAVVHRNGGLYTPRAAVFLPPYAGGQHARIDYNYQDATPFPVLIDDISTGHDLRLGREEGNQTIAYAASVTPDPYLGGTVFVGTLTGNITVNNPAAPGSAKFRPGQRLAFYFTQDATAGRSVTWGSKFTLTGGALGTTGAGTVRRIEFEYLGSTLDVWREVGRN